MDPLAILKEFCLSGQLEQVVIDVDRVRFADKYSFPKQSPTAFRAKDGTGDYYSLEAVAFFIKAILAADANMGAYVTKAVNTRTEQIEFRDRQPLRDYLTGKIEHTVHIADVVPVVNFYEPAAKKQRVEEGGEAAALQHLFEQEKQLRNRNSLLCAPGANFKPVLDMLDKVLAARKQLDASQQAGAGKAATAGGSGKPGQQQQRPPGAAAAGQKPAGSQQQQQQQKLMYMKPSGRMERQNVVGDLKAMGGDAALAASLGYGYGIQVDAAQQQQQQQQPSAPAGNQAPSRPGQQQQQKGKQDSRTAAAASVAGSKHKAGSSSGGSGSGLGKQRGDPPIILVPSGLTAMINIFNARQFLEEGKFVRSEEAMAANPAKPTKAVEFSRTALRSGPRFPRYHITDKLPRPGSADWKRVVAVIVQGKAWQFKGFPYKGADKGELMETFTQLFGAYFHYSDEQVPENVAAWKVMKLPLRRTARHLDHTVMLDFYKALDAFLAGKRSELDY